MSDKEYDNAMRFSTNFFIANDKLWRKDPLGQHKLVIDPPRRLSILRTCHEDIAHKGVWATQSIVTQRFWWPYIAGDIAWFVRTCHFCQLRQLRNVRVPPTVAVPASLFAKMYIDTMHLPKSGGYKFIVQGRCSLCHYPEWRMLAKESAATIANWIFEDILCRWGAIQEIVSDNGSPFIAAMDYLGKRYGIHHIRISGYNSRANGIAERPHFDVRQALFKAMDGDQSKWSTAAHSVFWADRITPRRRMGCSPYFAATGTHPLIPLDIIEATYLLPPPTTVLSTEELIATRAIALQKRRSDLERLHSKVYNARRKRALEFERTNTTTIRDFKFTLGDLVLVRNTAIEKALNRKMRARYFGPLVFISRNRGGALLLCELDGTLLDRPTAAFRVVPYFARKKIVLPDLERFIDVPIARLRELEDSTFIDPDDILGPLDEDNDSDHDELDDQPLDEE